MGWLGFLWKFLGGDGEGGPGALVVCQRVSLIRQRGFPWRTLKPKMEPTKKQDCVFVLLTVYKVTGIMYVHVTQAALSATRRQGHNYRPSPPKHLRMAESRGVSGNLY